MDATRNFLADLFEARDRATETNVERRRFEFLLQLRDWNRIGNDRDTLRSGPSLIPTPAVPPTTAGEHEEEDENDGDGAMGAGPETRSLQPGRSRPGELAEQEREETFKHNWIGILP